MLTGYSPLTGAEGVPQSSRTRENAILLADPSLRGDDGMFSFEELQAAWFSNRALHADLLRDQVVKACDDQQVVLVEGLPFDITPACDVLRNWDGRLNNDSRGAVLWREFLIGFSGDDQQAASSPTTASGPVVAADGSALTVPGSTLPPLVIVTDPAAVKSQLTSSLSKGMYGDDVKAMQQRLFDLGFQPGPIDGQFGSGTQQALWAFEKLVLNVPSASATGVLTNEMWQTMQDNISIQPSRTNSTTTHVEVYLDKQVLVVFKSNVAEFITHISSGQVNPDGTPKTFCEEVTIDTDDQGRALPEPEKKGSCAESKTPGGVFKFTRRYEGKRVGPLGGMYDPVYFNYGIAIHGAENVPLEPASHGCIRILV